jgi:N utilization substance protein B
MGVFMCSVFSSLDEENVQDFTLEIKSYDDFSQRDVRALVFHFLYAMEAFDYQVSLQSLVDNFNRGFGLNIPLNSEFCSIVQSIIDSRHELEKIYEPYLSNWRTERLSVCTKLILLFGIWELKNTTTDTRIVINEAIELAKCFAEEDSYRFVNGILDSLAKDLRKECNSSNES